MSILQTIFEDSSGNSILRDRTSPTFIEITKIPKRAAQRELPGQSALGILLTSLSIPCPGVCVRCSCVAENSRLYLIIEVYRSVSLKKVPSLLLKPETRLISMHFAEGSIMGPFHLDTLRLMPTSVQASAFSLLNLFYSSRPRKFGPEGK